jgi:hypothetical protein
MQIVYHLGAHCTDNGAINDCLAKNRGRLSKEGVLLPWPGRYKPVLRDTLQILKGEKASPDIQQIMLDTIIDEDEPDRIIFSHSGFLGGPIQAIGDDTFYPLTANRVRRLANLFPDDEIEFCLSIRNPATFLPNCFSLTKASNFQGFVAQIDIQTLLWSELTARLVQLVPNARVTVWANEDTPFIWSDIIRSIAGVDGFFEFRGINDFINELMDDEGIRRLDSYLKNHPPQNDDQRRRVVAAFLEKFGKEDALEEELDCPGWTDDTIEEMTEIYEDDLLVIESQPGVNFISP